jgi:lysozyme family protein
VGNFTLAVDYAIYNETGGRGDGGLTKDSGGLTKWGISQAAYPLLDIKSLTRDDAVVIYKRDYWLFENIASDRTATKLFDLYVNMMHGGIKCVQWALGHLMAGPIVADGVWGPKTEECVNAADETRFIDELKLRLVKFRYDHVVANPTDAIYLLGWWRRDVKG